MTFFNNLLINSQKMKTDARVRYTKKVLRDSLFDCLKEKSINNVTVKEVCEKADLNRATFYKHYKDCYDLIEQLQAEELKEFEQLFKVNDKYGKKLTGDILALLDKYADLNEAVVNGKVADRLKTDMIRISEENCIAEWKEAMPKATDDEVEMLFTSICASIFELAISKKGSYPNESIIDFIHSMLISCINNYV